MAEAPKSQKQSSTSGNQESENTGGDPSENVDFYARVDEPDPTGEDAQKAVSDQENNAVGASTDNVDFALDGGASVNDSQIIEDSASETVEQQEKQGQEESRRRQQRQQNENIRRVEQFQAAQQNQERNTARGLPGPGARVRGQTRVPSPDSLPETEEELEQVEGFREENPLAGKNEVGTLDEAALEQREKQLEAEQRLDQAEEQVVESLNDPSQTSSITIDGETFTNEDALEKIDSLQRDLDRRERELGEDFQVASERRSENVEEQTKDTVDRIQDVVESGEDVARSLAENTDVSNLGDSNVEGVSDQTLRETDELADDIFQLGSTAGNQIRTNIERVPDSGIPRQAVNNPVIQGGVALQEGIETVTGTQTPVEGVEDVLRSSNPATVTEAERTALENTGAGIAQESVEATGIVVGAAPAFAKLERSEAGIIEGVIGGAGRQAKVIAEDPVTSTQEEALGEVATLGVGSVAPAAALTATPDTVSSSAVVSRGKDIVGEVQTLRNADTGNPVDDLVRAGIESQEITRVATTDTNPGTRVGPNSRPGPGQSPGPVSNPGIESEIIQPDTPDTNPTTTETSTEATGDLDTTSVNTELNQTLGISETQSVSEPQTITDARPETNIEAAEQTLSQELGISNTVSTGLSTSQATSQAQTSAQTQVQQTLGIRPRQTTSSSTRPRFKGPTSGDPVSDILGTSPEKQETERINGFSPTVKSASQGITETITSEQAQELEEQTFTGLSNRAILNIEDEETTDDNEDEINNLFGV